MNPSIIYANCKISEGFIRTFVKIWKNWIQYSWKSSNKSNDLRWDTPESVPSASIQVLLEDTHLQKGPISKLGDESKYINARTDSDNW